MRAERKVYNNDDTTFFCMCINVGNNVLQLGITARWLGNVNARKRMFYPFITSGVSNAILIHVHHGNISM